jgi:predicted MFS family arabinose efflux permease
LISGMGAILFNLVITKMTADWFARREIVLAMAVILSTWPFGIALGLFTQPRIAGAFGWRSVMLLAGGICLLSMLLVTTVLPVAAGRRPDHPRRGRPLPASAAVADRSPR